MSDDDAPPARRRWIGWTIGLAVLIVVLAGGWVAVRGIGAGVSLASAADGAEELRTMVAAGETDRLTAVASRVAADAANARALTSDPVWRAAEVIPWLGGNLRAVRQVSEVADDVASDGIAPLLTAAKGVDLGTLGISGGHIELAPLVAIAPSLRDAADVFAKAERAVRGIDAGGTIPPLAKAVGDLVEEVDTVARATGQLAGAAELLPPMLNGDEPHTYLLLMQNNAELRSSGGNPGAFALLHASGGTISLGTQASTADFRQFAEPVADLPASMVALFGDLSALRIQRTLSAPDFATGARLAATMWTKTKGDRIDGVIAVDTVVITYLLKATGALQVDGVELTAKNATAYLLGDVYRERPDPKKSDAFFRAVATRVFSALTDGTTEPRTMLSALVDAGDSDRVRMWSADPDIQKRIAATSLAGAIPADGGGLVHPAVLMNDTTGAKMDFFADARVDARIGACGAKGRPVLRMSVDWSSSAPADAATSLPAYVTGAGWLGVPPGITGTRIAVFGPQGWIATASSATGEVAGDAATVDDGRPVVQYELRTPPGGTQRIVVEFTAPEARALTPSALDVRTTPMIRQTPVRTGILDCEGR